MVNTFDPDSDNLPKLADLQPIPNAPDRASWFWGEDDELGRLNLLTPKRVVDAGSLIKTGERVTLNFPAELPNPPLFGREPFTHTLKHPVQFGFDDLYTLNTQSGSQWDGFRHVAAPHAGSYVWYNNTTEQHILSSNKIGLQAWAKKGIVGRGVLIDFYSFSGKSYDPFTSRKISAQEILSCAKEQKVHFQYGDILIVRTGFSEAYRKLTLSEREVMGHKTYEELNFAGLDRSPETIDFLHDNYFSAVGGDAPAFESWPMDDPEHLHHFLLARWGVPIGELWDLDGLAELCRKHNRYEFFFTSSPANVQGGVGTHVNAIAIF